MGARFKFLHADGFSAAEIRKIDWSENPLGAPDTWPPALRTVVQMMLASHFPKAVVWGPHYITLFNDAFRPILGAKKNCMGRPFNEIWAEAWDEVGPIAEKAYRGEATFIEDFPLLIERYGYPEQCYFTFCYSPIRLEDGSVGGMMDTVIEATAKVQAEKNAAVFNAELAHRIKNTFSVVNAIANQTFHDVDSEKLDSFAKRLSALSNAHDVLRLGRTSQGALAQIIGGIVSALGVEGRVDTEIPDIAVGSKGAASTSLLIHELMTNAIKYGALSNDKGRVHIEASIVSDEDTDKLLLRWKEEGGPEVAKPSRKGFGTKLIRMGLLGAGNVTMDFLPQGFEAQMLAPLYELQSDVYDNNG